MPAIDIQGLSKRFGQVQAVSDLSFAVEAGRVTGFLGPNGAGKSTTLRMLLGLIHANAGTATGLPTAIQDIPPEDVGIDEGADLLAPGLALLAMLAWIGTLFAGGAALLQRRDLD